MIKSADVVWLVRDRLVGQSLSAGAVSVVVTSTELVAASEQS